MKLLITNRIASLTGLSGAIAKFVMDLVEGYGANWWTVLVGVFFGIWALYFWLPDKDGNRVPDVLDRLSPEAAAFAAKWLVPIFLALAAALGISQTGCGAPPDEPVTEWIGERFDATASGELHYVDGEWHGDGALRATFEAKWRIWKIYQTLGAFALVDRDGVMFGQSLDTDVAGVVEPEQDFVCLLYLDEGAAFLDCRVCGYVGDAALCQSFGRPREVPLPEGL